MLLNCVLFYCEMWSFCHFCHQYGLGWMIQETLLRFILSLGNVIANINSWWPLSRMADTNCAMMLVDSKRRKLLTSSRGSSRTTTSTTEPREALTRTLWLFWANSLLQRKSKSICSGLLNSSRRQLIFNISTSSILFC